jgi:hypothetical protein
MSKVQLLREKAAEEAMYLSAGKEVSGIEEQRVSVRNRDHSGATQRRHHYTRRNTVMKRAIVLALGVILALAMAAPVASAQATTSTQIQEIDATGVETRSPCGENVLITGGTVKIVTHITETEGGSRLIVVDAHYQNITGVGQISGDEYLILGSEHRKIHQQGDPGPLEFDLMVNLTIVNQESGSVQHGTAYFLLRENANGEETVSLEESHILCPN